MTIYLSIEYAWPAVTANDTVHIVAIFLSTPSWHPAIYLYPNLVAVLFVCTPASFVSILPWYNIDGLVQERHNSSALAMELCLSCTNLSIWFVRMRTTFRRILITDVCKCKVWSIFYLFCMQYHLIVFWCHNGNACKRLLWSHDTIWLHISLVTNAGTALLIHYHVVLFKLLHHTRWLDCHDNPWPVRWYIYTPNIVVFCHGLVPVHFIFSICVAYLALGQS